MSSGFNYSSNFAGKENNNISKNTHSQSFNNLNNNVNNKFNNITQSYNPRNNFQNSQSMIKIKNMTHTNYNISDNFTSSNASENNLANPQFDFEKKIDYLLLTNAFTKLRNENRSYEELENLALKLEIANVKYSKKYENMKFEIIRLNQRIIDLNSYLKESDIQIKKLLNKISYLEKDRGNMLNKLFQSQEMLKSFNTYQQYDNSGFQTYNEQDQLVLNQQNAGNAENANISTNAPMIDKKYLIRSSNPAEIEKRNTSQKPIIEKDTDNEASYSKSRANRDKSNNNPPTFKKQAYDSDEDVTDDSNIEDINVPNKNKALKDSIIEDTDSSLIEGFENNESILDSIKKRVKHKAENKQGTQLFKWKDIMACNNQERIIILDKINNFDSLKRENKRLKAEIEALKAKTSDLDRDIRSYEKIIKEKDDIIQIFYKEMDNLKKENLLVTQSLNNIKKAEQNNNKFHNNHVNNTIKPGHRNDTKTNNYKNSKLSERLEAINYNVSDISDLKDNEIDSEYNSPAMRKIKNYIKDNTPSTVNKNYFYRNNQNYREYVHKNSRNSKSDENNNNDDNNYNFNYTEENLENDRNAEFADDDSFVLKNQKKFKKAIIADSKGFNMVKADIRRDKNNKYKLAEKFSNYDFEENIEKQKNSTQLSKNNFTFQEAEINKQNESSQVKRFNDTTNSEFLLKCESEKKMILKNLEELKKDLDLFLRDYGIKEHFNTNNIANPNYASEVDFQIEIKFKEIRYITVNLKKINIIFKSLFVEFTKNISSRLEMFNNNVNSKFYYLENKIQITTNEITSSLIK